MSTVKSDYSDTPRSIAKSAGILGVATFVSRILGFIRDMVISRVFGVHVYAQAFVVAFKIPNLFRDLLGEGAANAAFVPVFKEYLIKRRKEEFWELANMLLNLLLVILTAITLIGIVAAPLIIRLIAPGFTLSPEKLETTVRLTRIIYPYVLLICLATYATALLNSLKHFSVPAFAPCILNISIIVCALVWGEGVAGLATGVLIGGVLQILVQVPVLYKKGFRPQLFLGQAGTGAMWGKSLKHPGVRLVGFLMIPRLFSSCIYQLNNFVDSIFASFAFIMGEGGVAILYFAYRLIHFPIGVVSNSLAQVILPTFSAQALEGSRARLTKTLSFGLRSIFFVMLPVTVIFIVLSKSLVMTIYGGGKFDVYSSYLTARVLIYYAIGLTAYGATKILNSCFFALKDTITPTLVSLMALGLNLILNALLMLPMKLNGIALATAISGLLTFFVTLALLLRHLDSLQPKELGLSFLKILLASACMGGVCYLLGRHTFLLGMTPVEKFMRLGVTLIAAGVSYIGFCFIFRVSEIRELWRWLRRRQ